MTSASRPLGPGSTIGILGSGQLGRMLGFEARRLGYGVAVYSPDANTPTGAVADVEAVGPWTDLDRLRDFARGCHVVTYEFENVPTAAAEACREVTRVHPDPQVLAVAQDRLVEKGTAERHGVPVTAYRAVESEDDLRQAREALGEGILKTARSGYDGKGQQRVTAEADLSQVWTRTGGARCIYERRVPFDWEVSVVVVRAADGDLRTFPVTLNHHANHILDVSRCPAGLDPKLERRATELARELASGMNVVGVVCVEMFVAGQDVLLNELAPRPHNSGHWTLDCAEVSQFEQQLRAVCGLPLGSAEATRPCAMANLLGDLWFDDAGRPREPNWNGVLGLTGVRLHLYGKAQARPGRKMGHLTGWADSADVAEQRVRAARARLSH